MKKKFKDLSTIHVIQQDVKLAEVDAGEEKNRVLGGANSLQDVLEVEGGGNEDKFVCFDSDPKAVRQKNEDEEEVRKFSFECVPTIMINEPQLGYVVGPRVLFL